MSGLDHRKNLGTAGVLVFWKEKLVLFSVPKTGTTALQGVLAPRASIVLRHPPGVKHLSLLRYRQFVAPMLGASEDTGFETVAVVREPVSWLSSWYRYRHREALAGHAHSTRGMSFDDFVRAYVRGKSAPFAAVGSQAKLLSDEAGVVGITHLFRHEEPERLMDFLAARLGPINRDLPRLNVSPEVEARLSPEVEALLRQKRAADFSLWERAGQRPETQ